MFSTAYGGNTVYVINDAWNVKRTLDVEFGLVRDLQSGLTNRSERRPFSSSLRVNSLRYTATVRGSDLLNLQGSLRLITTEQVVVPFWPAQTTWANRAAAPFIGGLRMVWKADWSQFAIYLSTDAEPGWPAAGDYFAPAVMGYLTPTKPEMIHPSAALWDVDFAESSEVNQGLSVGAIVPPSGPEPAGYSSAPPILPYAPDYRSIKNQISVKVNREQIGFTRTQSQTFYPQLPTRIQDASFTLQCASIQGMVAFLMQVGFVGQSFFANTGFIVAQLTANIASADTVLNVSTTAAIQDGDYIFINANLVRKILSHTATTITVDSAVGVNCNASFTCISQACLAIFNSSNLKMSWLSSSLAKSQIAWEEVSAEYVPPSDETLNTTLGALPQGVILFEFQRDLQNGTTITTRLTNYETDINDGVNVWTHANIGHGDIKQSLNMEADGVEITSFLTDVGNPMVPDVGLQSEATLAVTIFWADYDGASVTNVQTVFTGNCSKPNRQGRKIKMQCTWGSAVYDSHVPRLIRGTVCNHLGGSNNDGSFLISAGCTLLKATWQFTAVVIAPVSGAFPISFNLNTIVAVDAGTASAIVAGTVVIFSDFFALGWVEWNTAANIQRRQIIGSTVISGGDITLNLAKWFNGAGPQIGDAVTFYPGCDGSYTTCQAYNFGSNPRGKFNNYPNFGAEPFTPPGNPSLLGSAIYQVQGGKK